MVCRMDSYRILIGVCDRGRFWRYRKAVERAGFLPVFVPEAYDMLNQTLQGRLMRCIYADRRFCKACSERFDGLLLPGGGDIHPAHFDQIDRFSTGIEVQTDRMQFYLTEAFAEARKPILGVCKGMQLINILFGGSLYQELPVKERQRHAYDTERNQDRVHDTWFDSAFLPAGGLDIPCVVNSAHHQAIDRIGNGLKVVQWAEDGVVEGICHVDLPAVGFQWHPERWKNEKADAFFRLVWEFMFQRVKERG